MTLICGSQKSDTINCWVIHHSGNQSIMSLEHSSAESSATEYWFHQLRTLELIKPCHVSGLFVMSVNMIYKREGIFLIKYVIISSCRVSLCLRFAWLRVRFPVLLHGFGGSVCEMNVVWDAFWEKHKNIGVYSQWKKKKFGDEHGIGIEYDHVEQVWGVSVDGWLTVWSMWCPQYTDSRCACYWVFVPC